MERYIFGMLFVSILLLDFHIIDRIIKYEYKNLFDQWVVDGKPIGYFWYPSDHKSHKLNYRTRHIILSNWLFIAPDWIEKDNYTKVLLWLHRIFTLLTVIIVIVYLLRTKL